MDHTLRTHAVRFSQYGGPEVLEVVEIPTPEPGEGEVLVEVFATGLNPVESAVRRGDHPERWPVEFPAAQGRDLAGVVRAVGPGVPQFSRGDEVMGYVDRGAHATHVVVPERQLLPKPPSLSWEVAGSLYVAGTTAWTAVEGLGLGPSDTVVITAAAGGVGCLAAQFARMRGATVIGTCVETRFDFLRQFGVIPLEYGPGSPTGCGRWAMTQDRAGGRPVSAFLDFLGGQTHEAIRARGSALAHLHRPRLGCRRGGPDAVKLDAGDVVALGRVAALVAGRRARLPIADVFPLDSIADAYRALDRREAPGKIVLGLRVVDYPGRRFASPSSRSRTSRSACRRRTRTWTSRRPCRRPSATAACDAGIALNGNGRSTSSTTRATGSCG